MREEAAMSKRGIFKFNATVSDRGQIFIPRVLQQYFGIKSRDKVTFMVKEDGSVIFLKKRGNRDE
jgi:bifunctional DNA-binding transcriptional regulator/antitoxin component of YhaV-PrlF toxin-antitoxin module